MPKEASQVGNRPHRKDLKQKLTCHKEASLSVQHEDGEAVGFHCSKGACRGFSQLTGVWDSADIPRYQIHGLKERLGSTLQGVYIDYQFDLFPCGFARVHFVGCGRCGTGLVTGGRDNLPACHSTLPQMQCVQ